MGLGVGRLKGKFIWALGVLLPSLVGVHYFAFRIDEFARKMAVSGGESDVSEVIFRSVILNHTPYFQYALMFLSLVWSVSLFILLKKNKMLLRIILATVLFVSTLLGEMLFYKNYFSW